MSKAKKLNKAGNRYILIAAFCPLFAWVFLLVEGINKKREANRIKTEELKSEIRKEVEKTEIEIVEEEIIN